MTDSTAENAVRVCGIDEVREERALCARLPRGSLVSVARLANGAIAAFENVCPHMKAPLGEGKIRDGIVTCPWHGFRFDIRTGGAYGLDSIMKLRTFRTEVRDGQVFVFT
jgi:nitrite reductase/ring-hydroxylating ferredoxin subunit